MTRKAAAGACFEEESDLVLQMALLHNNHENYGDTGENNGISMGRTMRKKKVT
jgi:hypothetical protein